MNKYQEALKIMCSDCNQVRYCICNGFNENCNSYAPLKELVERATPKKVVYKQGNDGDRWFFCPRCNEIVPRMRNFDQHTYPYCPYCGGKIDWSEYFDVD